MGNSESLRINKRNFIQEEIAVAVLIVASCCLTLFAPLGEYTGAGAGNRNGC